MITPRRGDRIIARARHESPRRASAVDRGGHGPRRSHRLGARVPPPVRGLRTHLLVALASSTFMVVSTHFVYFQHYHRDDLISVDTSRIAASVVAGTGFIAGGAILRTGLTVQGLTTGAGLWLVSSIGLAAGGGMYPEGVGATAIGLIALSVIRRLEFKEESIARGRFTATTTAGAGSLATAAVDAHGWTVTIAGRRAPPWMVG